MLRCLIHKFQPHCANNRKTVMLLFKLPATLLIAGAIAGVLVPGAAYSQAASAPRSTGAAQPNGAPAPVPLTAAELATVKTVLAPYKSANLTAQDAKTIKRTLRDAGLRRNRELEAALVAAGFSPEKLDLLDPPPPRPAGDGAPPPPSPPPGATPVKK
jgi:hypothetical protein